MIHARHVFDHLANTGPGRARLGLTARADRGRNRLSHGSTLMEVLVAMAIMSIGLVSLAALFPVSVLRTVKGAQLTSAAILRYSVESMIDSSPSLKLAIRNQAQPLDPVTGSPLQARPALFDPLGFWDPNLGNGVSPQYYGNESQFSAGLSGAPAPMLRIVDPSQLLIRTGGGTIVRQSQPIFTSLSASQRLCYSPDAWSTEFEGTVYGYTVGDNAIKATGFGASNTFLSPSSGCRVVVFSVAGDTSHARDVTVASIAGDSLPISSPLPTSFNNPGLAWIQSRQPRYSWALTVRPTGVSKVDLDCVVFSERSFALADEQLYPGPAKVFPFREKSAYAVIEYPASARPTARQGGFMLDSANGFWYRILGISKVPSSLVTFDVSISALPQNERGLWAGLALDLGFVSAGLPDYTQFPLLPAGSERAVVLLNQSASANGKFACAPRGVVDVYPLGLK